MSAEYGELRPMLAAEIVSLVWAPQLIPTRFASWQRYCTAVKRERQPNFAALNRGRHLCSAGRPSRWTLAHILVPYILPVAVAESSSDGSARSYVLPVLWMTSFYPYPVSFVTHRTTKRIRYRR